MGEKPAWKLCDDCGDPYQGPAPFCPDCAQERIQRCKVCRSPYVATPDGDGKCRACQDQMDLFGI